MFFRNVDKHLPNYTGSHPRRQHSSDLCIDFQIVFSVQVSEQKLCMRFSYLSCISLIPHNPMGMGGQRRIIIGGM